MSYRHDYGRWGGYRGRYGYGYGFPYYGYPSVYNLPYPSPLPYYAYSPALPYYLSAQLAANLYPAPPTPLEVAMNQNYY
jgi:hypothetical protein